MSDDQVQTLALLKCRVIQQVPQILFTAVSGIPVRTMPGRLGRSH